MRSGRCISDNLKNKNKMSEQQRIGITGGIGSGKTTVCRVLQVMGFPVYYSDDEAKRIMHEDKELVQQILEAFGKKAYVDSRLNRSFLAEVVFRQPDKKNALNQLVHPKVRADFARWCDLQRSWLVFQESALLFETGGYKLLDKTVLVTAPETVRVQRVAKRDVTSAEAVQARINNQMKDEEKIPLADFVIENDDRQLVIPQVLNMLDELAGNGTIIR
jgi:dephospho-CoA kinase